MKTKAIWEYIVIGTELRYLQDVQPNYPIFGGEFVENNIKRLIANIEKLNLDVTYRACEGLKELLKELETHREVNKMNAAMCAKLKEELKLVRHTLSAETRGKYAFFTTDKKYDVEKLLDKIEKIFSPNVFDSLPAMAKYDFSEAGKCIAFERATAAAFHILRATEVIVRLYYQKYLRKKPEGKTWGQLLNELKNKNTGKQPNAIVLNHLVNIKDSFRNPTQHPDKFYDIYEAQDLLSVCIDVVNKMMVEIN
ncbi:MAG: hypothetical protein IPN73_16875 [Saprospiraceae bacterium]|nr:hypothetical protein [Saprospiraceae bacterium]